MAVAYDRPPADFYRTPDWAIAAVLRRLTRLCAPSSVLEPCAGDGALLAPLRACWPSATIDAYDIEPRHPAVARPTWTDDTPQRYDLVITNPPFIAAEEILRYGISRLRAGGRIALLLRLGFLASQERRPLYRRHYPEFVFVLSERPSFRSGTTDATDYAWFVWREGRRARHGRIEHL